MGSLEDDGYIFIELNTHAFMAADWRVVKPEPPRENRLGLCDASVRKAIGLPFGLLEIEFEESTGRRLWWRPKWEDVRNLFYMSGVTELCNMGADEEQLAQFRAKALDTLEALTWSSRTLIEPLKNSLRQQGVKVE